ncbi:hypothetical protein [Nocardia sp. CA-135398]|uniref:hypothetical protein n=1 Tax=Nocardia sp. CA-135398 TaxID=3239977 RepID=UPI003D96DB42
MPSDRPECVVYGLTPDKPLAFTVPPIEAEPDQPLPNAGSFLRVFSGAEEPTTVMLRCAQQFIGIQRLLYDHGREAPDVIHEQLSVLTFLINREAEGHTKEIAVAAGAPTNPTSYGEMVFWLSWKYLLYGLQQHDPEHSDRDAAALLEHCQAFDQLVEDVRAGGVRLPDQATDVLPPKTIRPDGTEFVHGQAHTSAANSGGAADVGHTAP